MVSLLAVGALAVLGLLPSPAGAADQAPVTAVAADGPIVAAAPLAYPAITALPGIASNPGPASSEQDQSPVAIATVDTPAAAGAPTAAARALATEPAKESEQPEGTVKPPELVGPDDDRLLKEVEKRVNISAPQPTIKLAEPIYDIPLELNAMVLDYVEIFQTTRRRNFEQGLLRSKMYEGVMKPIFKEYGLPTDLYYLALIESAYNPKAYSYAKAAGIWQFIGSTGSLYGLRRSQYVDERCDPTKATRAAARHLKDLYDELGSWPLVLAAYNAGKGRVQRDIAKAGTTDFWSLPLPAQTRNYVPAFYAALIIAKEPERYGFQPDYEDPPESDVIDVSGGTRLSLIAALCGTSVDAVRELNPELRRAACPPGGKYALRIPAGTRTQIAAGLAKVPAGKTTPGWSTYRVAPGDTLFSIAQRFGTTPEAIEDANRLNAGAIHPGDQLTVPGQRTAAASIPRAPGRVVVPSAMRETYRVQSGDNPWSIAKRFDVPLADLLAWNALDEDSVLSIGQPLTLREPPATGTRTSAHNARTVTYEVKKGDNLWEIARKFDASVEVIRRVNGFGPGHRLQVGDRLTLPE